MRVMLRSPTTRNPLVPAALAAVCLLGLTDAVHGQPAASGLDAVPDGAVIDELVRRGLDDLLNHTLDARGIPEDQRDAYRAQAALNRLSDESLSLQERRDLALRVAAGIEPLIAGDVPPDEQAARGETLLASARLLTSQAIDQEVRLIEYFGDDAGRRRFLQPVADAVANMLTRAQELLVAEGQRLEMEVQSVNDPRLPRISALNRQAREAAGLAVMARYHRLLGTDPDAQDRRTQAAALAQELAPFAVDRNPNRVVVLHLLGKIHQAHGGETGRENARQAYQQVIVAGDDPIRIFDAYFGNTVVAAEEGDAEAAQTQREQFEAWFASQQDNGQGPLAGREPLMLVLRYRIADALSRTAATEAEREAAAGEAIATLTDLVAQYEAFRPIVTEVLLAQIGTDADADLEGLPTLVLDSIVDAGRGEAARSLQDGDGGPPMDEESVRRAVDAAALLYERLQAGGEDTPPASLVAKNTFNRGLMLQVLGDDQAAADAYLQFGDIEGVDPDRRLAAYQRALGIVDDLKRDAAADSDEAIAADAIEARLLPILVDEYNDVSRAFDLASRLHRNNELAEASRYYQMVPADDPRRPDANRLLFLARYGVLQQADDAADRRGLVAEVARLGEAAVQSLQQAAAAATRPELERAYRGREAQVRIDLASLELAERDDPAAAMTLLQDLEERVAGLDNADSLVAQAMPLRFQATAAAGDVDAATQDLLALLDQSDAEQGFRFISQFQLTLNRAYERADRRGDVAGRRQVTETRAAVTPKLVDWIENVADADFRKYAYTFRRLDAETQLQAAAELEGDARTARLEAARDRLLELQSAENLEQWRDLLELDDAQRQQARFDPKVRMNLGRAYYLLGDYGQARQEFGRLLQAEALGGPVVASQDPGVGQLVPNEDYWEAQLRFVQSGIEVGAPRDTLRGHVERLQILYGTAFAENRFAEEFATLRQELSAEG
jgi:hypothetical protein